MSSNESFARKRNHTDALDGTGPSFGIRASATARSVIPVPRAADIYVCMDLDCISKVA